ncbi:AfsR/SARP family transcriptional regulator [Saccharothrix saharensis]|uniref:AfsR/SARP family transcriptional regulator n=1 Tax=Saccharothrix saharensis TaxID=571190 RepID=UPI001FE502AD|nr:BTAD domain-containing putative transcriptional regulator [Saccharothrix saharensis]
MEVDRRVVVGVLGELKLWLDNQPQPLGHARQRSVLAVLAVEANRMVSVDSLIDRVWGERPPGTARSALRVYLTHLRRALAPSGITITRSGGGYALAVEADIVDLHRFHRLLALVREQTDPQRALAVAEDALALWRGEPLAELDTVWAQAMRERLRRERTAAETDRIDWVLACGRHRQVLPELTTRAEAEPLDERVAGQLMLALYRDGRQADALAHYQHTRRHLVDELGTNPGTALHQLHQRILTADPALAPTEIATVTVATGSSPVPRQLPAPPRWFTGRVDHLAALDANLDHQGTAVIFAIGGAGGIGKTWLALAWAYRHLDRFPDGQLFVDLRGFSPDGTPTDPAVALRGFLDALGVLPDRIPSDIEARAALFRSLAADRRMLILLDNAANTTQVTPLLPGGDTCTVLVTSRHRLSGLVTAHGAHHRALDVLTKVEARVLFARRLGVERITAEPAAVTELIALCGGYPLALGIIATRGRTQPGLPLAELAAELHETGLDALDDTDPAASLPIVLSWSHHALSSEQRTVFALLGIAPGPDMGLHAAASLTGLSPVQTRTALNKLAQASLIGRTADGRYRMHDLIRRYAVDAAHRGLTEQHRNTALRRVIDHYAHTAHTASRLVHPHNRDVVPRPAAPGCRPEEVHSQVQAWAWFHREHECVLAAQHAAAERGDHRTGWLLMRFLYPFHHLSGDFHRHAASCRTALSAALHLEDPVMHSDAHRLLGLALCRIERYEEGMDHLRMAETLARRLGDARCLTRTHEGFALAWDQQGQHELALRSATRALRFVASLHNPVWQATAHTIAGRSAARLGLHELATSHCLAAIPLQQEHGDHDGEANSVFTLGLVAQDTGDSDRAVLHFRRSLAVFRAHANAPLEADTLDLLGHAYAALRQQDRTREVWREALDLYQEQRRREDAERVQRQLCELDLEGDPAIESAK